MQPSPNTPPFRKQKGFFSCGSVFAGGTAELLRMKADVSRKLKTRQVFLKTADLLPGNIPVQAPAGPQRLLGRPPRGCRSKLGPE